MFLVFLVAGLILLLAGSGWFTGAATVGVILLAVAGVTFLAQLVVGAAAMRSVNKVRKDFDRW